MNIHELDTQIESMLEASQGELTVEIEALLEQQGEIEKWIANATKKYFNTLAQIAAVKSEYDRIAKLKAEYEETAERLKRTLAKLVGEGNKRDLGFAKLGWRKSESVEIVPGKEESLPDAYLIAKWVPNKIQIKQDLKAGAQIPHCELVEKMNIQIK